MTPLPCRALFEHPVSTNASLGVTGVLAHNGIIARNLQPHGVCLASHGHTIWFFIAGRVQFCFLVFLVIGIIASTGAGMTSWVPTEMHKLELPRTYGWNHILPQMELEFSPLFGGRSREGHNNTRTPR